MPAQSCLIGMGLAAGLLGSAGAPAAAAPPEAAAWIKANAIEFKTSEAESGLDDLARLRDVVGDARIVSLGEPTHGTREAFQMKHRLLEFLVSEMGFSIFSIEASTPESYALNDYVLEGKGDPKALIGGMYFWTWNTEEVLAMVEWMRRWNASHDRKVQFTGFDMQTSDVAARIAKEFCDTHAPELAAAFGPLPAQIRDAQTAAFGAGGAGGAFGVATGSFPTKEARGKKLVFSGWIRTEDLEGWAGLWWRCDGADGKVVAFDNMQDRAPKGTTPWARYEIVLDVPEETSNINFGMIMPGSGTAWFDDLEITLDGAPFGDPGKLCLDFEDENVKSFRGNPAGYENTRSDVQPHGGARCLQIKSKPKPTAPPVDPKAVRAAAEKAFQDLAARRDEIAAKAGAKETDWAIHNARIVSQCARMSSAEGGAGEGSNIRDESMAENVGWILEQNPGAKIVLWAHNAHVSRGTMWGMRWMGSHLEEMFPGQMTIFGFATSAGEYTAADTGRGLRSDNRLQEPPEDSVEAFLASAGMPNLILDLRRAKEGDAGSGWVLGTRPMRGIGAMAMEEQFSPCNPGTLYDVLVYQAQTTAARQLDTKPPGSRK